MTKYLTIFLLCMCPQIISADTFLLGDVDGDGTLTMVDVARLIDCLKTPSHYYAGVDYIDLKLPSGLLWAKKNIGATNVEDYGEHYAWGEIAPKDSFVWDTYQWGTAINKLTKYCTNSSYGTVDNHSTLLPEDDIAHVTTNSAWHIPTVSNWLELKDNCNIWEDSINHKKGYSVLSMKNYKSFYLPSSGYREDDYIYNEGLEACYWANGTYPYNSSTGYCFHIGTYYIGYAYRSRYMGNPVRAVIYPYEKVCDINSDGQVNIADVTALANLVLQKE